jgi:CubicO group peptidase (beta-lactamase class C family)
MGNNSVSVITLPQPALMRQWMVKYHVPAVGVGLVNGERMTSKVYGELSKGIPAPQNTVWGSEALANAIAILDRMGAKGMDSFAPVDLFTELNMPDTTFGDPIKVLNRMARPHNKRDGIYVFKPYDTENHLFTTVNDYCKLLAYINKQPDVVAMLTTVTETIEETNSWKPVNTMPAGREGIIHYAVGNGSSHAILLLPQSRQAVVVFTNSDNGLYLTQHIVEQSFPAA